MTCDMRQRSPIALAAPCYDDPMGHRSSLALATLVSLTVGVLLMPRDSDASGSTPPPVTCGIPGKDPAPGGTHCDDQNKCTTDDVCDGNGKCAGKFVLCPSGPCATAACNPETGACASTNRPDGTRCGPGVCKGGVCAINPNPVR